MARSQRILSRVRPLLALTVAVCMALAPAIAFAEAPTTTRTDPASGLGEPSGVPGASGWWVVPPLVSLASSQDGTLFWHWDSDSDTPVPVSAGVGVPVLAPEGDSWLHAYSVNSIGETETPGVFVRYLVDSETPSQPSPFSATLNPPLGVDLAWGTSTDPAGGSGLWGYRIYRKTGLPPFASADLLPTLVPAGTTTYRDEPPGSVDDYIYAVSALDRAGNESPLSEIDPTPTLISVYRFYNRRTGAHFYTASEAEKTSVIGHTDWPFTYEGVAYRAYGTPTGVVPLYRFYNRRTGAHFYTASEAEKASVIGHTDWPFTYEGVAYYVSMNSIGTLPVHRFYNRRTGTHFYTASEAEKDSVIGHTDWPFTYEGVAYYVLN